MQISLPAVAAAAVLAILATGAPAAADGVRCAGWPGAPGVPALLIYKPSCTCTGALFGRPKADRELMSVRVIDPPHQGAFAMSGLRNFSYTSPAATSGTDMVVLDVEWNERGRTVHRTKRLRIVSETAYYAAGGTRTGPGEGMTTSHMQAARRRRR